jgi:hypothetical protein
MKLKARKTKRIKKRNDRFATGPLTAPRISLQPVSAPECFARYEELKFRVGPDCRAVIQFSGVPTRTAVRNLISHLELSVDEFPTSVDIGLPQA